MSCSRKDKVGGHISNEIEVGGLVYWGQQGRKFMKKTTIHRLRRQGAKIKAQALVEYEREVYEDRLEYEAMMLENGWPENEWYDDDPMDDPWVDYYDEEDIRLQSEDRFWQIHCHASDDLYYYY